ncbi:MAG: invasion associated locus B family protein [Hyphomicrobiales bacterium]|nr:invasion associated locus B family protein [Hyphomicrobiales bacterium]MDE2114919.1 invasion associated locus B family protein [Hyphomicrobiales bacterium]
MLKVRLLTATMALGATLLMAASANAAQPAKKVQNKAGEAAPAAAPAQQPGGAVKADLIGLGKWLKICDVDQNIKKKVCYATRDFGTAANQPTLALAVYSTEGEKVKILRMLLPVGLLLQPGFRMSVDKGAGTAGAYQICFPNGCFAQTKLDPAALERTKKGTEMHIEVQNQGGQVITFNLPLEGFGTAFDGPAIDPKVLAAEQKAQQDQLKAALQQRAEEQRKALEKTAPAGAAPAAPAAATPAAPAAAAPAK